MAKTTRATTTKSGPTRRASKPVVPSPDVVAWPSKGPGRKRYVSRTSLDGVAAQLALDIAAELVDRIRVIADQMAREALGKMVRSK